jgi:hypothetical protein
MRDKDILDLLAKAKESVKASDSLGTVARIFFSRVSLKRFRWRLRIVYRKVVVVCRVKTKGETNLKTQTSCIRNRYVAETQTDKRETDLSNNPFIYRAVRCEAFIRIPRSDSGV